MLIVRKNSFFLLTRNNCFVFALGGAILSTAHPPISIPYIAIFVLASISIYWHNMKPNPRSSFFLGWFFGFGHFFFSLMWITEPFLVKPKETGILAPFALFLLAASLSIFWGLAFWSASQKNDYKYRLRSLLKLGALLSLAELLRSFMFTGFPWGLLGVAFVETPLGQSLALFGPYWLSSIVIILSFIILTGYKGFSIAVLGFGILFLYGENRKKDVSFVEQAVKVRVVQPNIDQKLKWKPELASSHIEKLFELSQNDLEEVDLIIWPETAVQFFLEYQKNFSDQVFQRVGKIMILGARKYIREKNELFNSAYVLDEIGQIHSSYDKKHLVPFGEYIPFAEIMKKFGVKGLASNGISGFTIGQRSSQMQIGDIPAFGIMICYESIFSHEVDQNMLGVDWLIHLTNDAWFGSYSGPQQHLMQSQARAIEQGITIFRSANTGISAVIDQYGRIVHKLDLNTEGYFDANLSKKLGTTLYSGWGAKSWNTLLFSLIVLIIILCFIKKDNKLRPVVR